MNEFSFADVVRMLDDGRSAGPAAHDSQAPASTATDGRARLLDELGDTDRRIADLRGRCAELEHARARLVFRLQAGESDDAGRPSA